MTAEPQSQLISFADVFALSRALKRAWSAETTATPDEWSERNPSWGQCAVTAAIVRDFFGGRVVWGEAILPDGSRVGHYWNEIDGVEVDFTRQQFATGTLLPKAGRRKPELEDAYDYVLATPVTRARYELLCQRLGLAEAD